MSKYLILTAILFIIVPNAISQTNCSNMELIGRTQQLLMVSGGNDIHVVGGYAYVCMINSFIIVDISDPKNPFILSRLGTPDSTMGIYVAGNYAYIANNESGVRVIDVSDPRNPIEADVFDTSGKAIDIHVSGEHAYVADGIGGLVVLDISNPRQIKKAGNLAMFALRLYIADDYAYVLGTREALPSLNVIDISNPNKMKIISSERFGGLNEEVYVDDLYAYVTSIVEGLYIVDISDPMDLRQASHYKKLGIIDSKISGNYAYTVTVDMEGNMVTRINAIDISDLNEMKEAGSCEIPKSVYTCIDAVGEYIYIIDGEGCLCILKFNAPKISVEPKHKLMTKWGYLRDFPAQ